MCSVNVFGCLIVSCFGGASAVARPKACIAALTWDARAWKCLGLALVVAARSELREAEGIIYVCGGHAWSLGKPSCGM